MENKVRLGYECPRWMPETANCPSGNEIIVDSENFENALIYKQRLIYLAFTKERESPIDPPGQWFRRLKLELGKSGCSDQNLVKGSIADLCSTPVPQRQKGLGAYNPGRDIKLRTPYILPRDCRLNVTYWNRSPNLTLSTYATFVALGRTMYGDEPIVLAGEGVETLEPGESQEMHSADLRNKGRREVLIERLIFKAFTYDVYGETGADESGTWIGYQVNPNVGTQWMPIDMPIPVGNLTPLARDENLLDRGPRVYLYPHDTWLYPNQSLSIKLSNESAVNASVNICMHTEVEVK